MVRVIDLIEMKNKKVIELQKEVAKLKEIIHRVPKLVIISASDNKASELYMRNKVKVGNEIGVDVEILRFGKHITQEQLEKNIIDLNNTDNVDGIIVQLPLFKHLDKDRVINLIDKDKDSDGFSYENLGMMFSGDHSHIIPCTAKSVYEMLKYHNVDVVGKRVCIIGKGIHTGKSLASLLINDGATVTVCNSKTTNMEDIIRDSDIVISSVGKYGLIKPSWLKEESVLIGIGIDYINGKQQTDYDLEDIINNSKCKLVSNRVNSVGLGTTLFLIENTIKLCKSRLIKVIRGSDMMCNENPWNEYINNIKYDLDCTRTLNPKKPIKPNYTNSENTIYTNQPEFIILELIDLEINKLKCNIKDLEKIKNDIYYMIKNNVDWIEVRKRIKKDN